MEPQTNTKLIYGVVIGAVLILFILISVYFKISNPNNLTQTPTRTPSRTPTTYIPPQISINPTLKPVLITEIPYISPEVGGGVDTESRLVKRSTEAINNLESSLPYFQSYTSSTGQEVNISIPDKELRDNTWTLRVSIEPIDYRIAEGDPQYEATKTTFQEAAATALAWIESQGQNPSHIIISWGDRAYIQEKAEKWLSEL